MKKGPAVKKWDFAIGTTSRVPNSNLHYVMGDIDGQLWPVLNRLLYRIVPNHLIIERTEHGWHFYTDYKTTFADMILLLYHIGCDKVWVDIGMRRGYLFLADKSQISVSWPVERMAIHGAKKRKKEHAGGTRLSISAQTD
jgi:hypothetical protein